MRSRVQRLGGACWAEQERLLEKARQRMAVEDTYIGATARRHGLTIVTANDQDFRRPGLRVSNLFKSCRTPDPDDRTRNALAPISNRPTDNSTLETSFAQRRVTHVRDASWQISLDIMVSCAF